MRIGSMALAGVSLAGLMSLGMAGPAGAAAVSIKLDTSVASASAGDVVRMYVSHGQNDPVRSVASAAFMGVSRISDENGRYSGIAKIAPDAKPGEYKVCARVRSGAEDCAKLTVKR